MKKAFWQAIIPPSPYSWQTFFLLGLFSLLMASLALGAIRELISTLGYLFLGFSLHWFGVKNKLAITPYISAWIICLFLWGLFKIEIHLLIEFGLFLTVILIGLPKFLTKELDWKLPTPNDRKNLIIILGINLLLSSWIEFYFTIGDWVKDYPSLLMDDFSKSVFVLKWDLETPLKRRNLQLLEALIPSLEKQLNNQPWSIVVSWLQQVDVHLADLQKIALTRIGNLPENKLWLITAHISSGPGGGYDLTLKTTWRGPRSTPPKPFTPDRYQRELLCKIRPQGAISVVKIEVL